MAKTTQPRISVNKLGEYIDSRPGRQTRILRDQKFPAAFITAYYRDAQEAICRFLASNMENYTILEKKIDYLEQQPTSNVQETRRLNNNIDAIESFWDMLDDIDLQGGLPVLGENSPAKLVIRNVEVSVRPEIILKGTGKSRKQLVGGLKLHFPKANPLSEEAAGFISTILQIFCRDCMPDDGQPHSAYCMVLDMASGEVWPGVKAIRRRQNEIESACAHIAALWPSISP